MTQEIKTKVRGTTMSNPDGTNRQELIDRYVETGGSLKFVREPKNPKSSNAIAVFTDLDGDQQYQIGYLSQDLADRFAPLIDQGKVTLFCEDVEKTGEDKENLGVNLVLQVFIDEKPVLTPASPPIPTPAYQKPTPAHTTYVTGTSDKRKGTALVLCIFLGFFGAHYFYVGRIGRGILYIFTAGLFMVGWIIDIFKILLGSFRDNVGNPLRA